MNNFTPLQLLPESFKTIGFLSHQGYLIFFYIKLRYPDAKVNRQTKFGFITKTAISPSPYPLFSPLVLSSGISKP
jgi:hypothetical protein